MKAKVIAIGNSKGVRIPSKVLKECGISDMVEMKVKGKSLVITPVTQTRRNWEEAAKQLMLTQKEQLHIPDDINNEEDV